MMGSPPGGPPQHHPHQQQQQRGDEPPAKKQKTEENLIPEQEFLAKNPPTVSFKVREDNFRKKKTKNKNRILDVFRF